ncbi:protein MRG1-like [Aristolochia californica]|uniref:protein MRG1-like n=1 Tax=Aristolochia californica TaxID=171875 RepID=UPI0035E11C59
MLEALIGTASLKVIRCLLTTVLVSTKPRFRKLTSRRRKEDSSFIILVGTRSTPPTPLPPSSPLKPLQVYQHRRIQQQELPSQVPQSDSSSIGFGPYNSALPIALRKGKSWDEWVTVDRLLKYTDENVKKHHVLMKNQSSDRTTKSGRSAQIKPKSSNGGRGKKRRNESGLEEKDTGSTEKLVKIQFPSTLRKQLVDDWEYVTQLGKLVKLPRSPNVDEIFKKYLDYRLKKDGTIAESVGEILKGLRGYFDKALPAMLLYKKERQQYREAVADNVSPSTIYGAEHLLRLFVKLPELLAYVHMEEEASKLLQQKLLDFLKYLQKNQSALFLSSYDGSKSTGETDEDQND